MKVAQRAILLAALLVVAALPLAAGVGPEARPWAPYNALSDVAALAIAREGSTIAAGLARAVTPPSTSGGVPTLPGTGTPQAAETDLAVLDYEYGFARNASVQAPTPLGRSHVAVSRDGSTVATLGRDTGTLQTGADGEPAASSIKLKLYYARVSPGGNWSSSTPFERTLDFGIADSVVPVGVALSDDGRRLAVLTGQGTQYVLRGYTFGGSSLDSAFELRASGAPRAFAHSSDLNRLFVVGQFPEGNFTYAGVHAYPFSQSQPLASFFERSANNTDVRSAAASRDGSVLATSGTDGRVFLFRQARDTLDAPATLSLGASGANLSVSEDGARLVGAVGTTLSAFDITSPEPALLWNATLTGQNLTGLVTNRTGGLILAGTSGTGGGVFALSDASNDVIWSLPGDTRAVAVNSDGTRVAYAQRASIGAAALPRVLSLELVGGGKSAPSQTVTAPGSTTFAVSLRNDGAATERVVFREGAPDVTVRTDPAVIVIRPGAILRVNLTVNVSEGLVGPRVFNVSAEALTSGAIDNVTLAIAPKPTLDVKLFLNESDVLARPGETSTVLVTIVNNGTADTAVGLRASQTVSQGSLWNLTLSETSFTALRGTRTTVKALMTPPADVENGTSATVQFTLEGPDVFDTARVVFRVNPELKVDLNATGVTRYIEPGKRAFYNVTVTNTGSLPRAFELFYSIVESSGRSWGVDMQSQTLRLEPLQSRSLPVMVIAPADALPEERVAVIVTAKSLPEVANETVVMDNVTLYGIAIAPKITTTTTPTAGIPFINPLAVVAVLLIACLPLRRRPQ